MSTVALARFLVVVSLFGLAVSAVGILRPASATDPTPRKIPVGLAFSVVCILGTFAAFRPGIFSGMIGPGEARSSPDAGSEAEASIRTIGHHPTCGPFQTHVISIRGRVFCAGCMGLPVGGLSAFIGAILYSFGNFDVWRGSLLPFWFPALGVAVGLLQFWPLELDGKRRAFANVCLALGAFLVLAKADEIAESLVLDFFILMLVGVWMMTRIALASWDHGRICEACIRSCGRRRDLRAL